MRHLKQSQLNFGEDSPPDIPKETLSLEQLQKEISDDCLRRVEVRLHRRRNDYVTVSRTPFKLLLEVHEAYLEAPLDVRQALSVFSRRATKKSRAIVVQYMELWMQQNPHSKRQTRCQTQGETYNLQPMFEHLNATYFAGALESKLTWGKKGTRPKRSIQFGSYCAVDDLIRMHPLLDRTTVPDYMVETVLHHEMCHAFIAYEEIEAGRLPSGAARGHGKRFQKLLMLHPLVPQALSWQNSNLGMFLKSTKNTGV